MDGAAEEGGGRSEAAGGTGAGEEEGEGEVTKRRPRGGATQMTNINRDPLLRAIFDAAQAVEACGASEALTAAVMAVTAIYRCR